MILIGLFHIMFLSKFELANLLLFHSANKGMEEAEKKYVEFIELERA